MIKALQEGWIAGAGLDVLETEPVGLATIHCSAWTTSSSPRVASASSRSTRRASAASAFELSLVLSGSGRACVVTVLESKPSAGSPSRWSAGRGTRG
jgi:D-3-phosphoglycerate dehydrogenase